MKDDLIAISSCISAIMVVGFTFHECAVVDEVLFLTSHSLGQHRTSAKFWATISTLGTCPSLYYGLLFWVSALLFFLYSSIPYDPGFIMLFSRFTQGSSSSKNQSSELSLFFLWLQVGQRLSKKLLWITELGWCASDSKRCFCRLIGA